MGISFELTALKSVRLHRFWTTLYSGSQTVDVYCNANGLKDASGNPISTGWYLIGTASATGLGSSTYVEIPVNLNLLMNPSDKYGFIIMASGNLNYNTGTSPYVFSDSYLSIDTECWGMSAGYPNFGFGFFPRQFNGKVTYDEGIVGPNDAGIASIDSPVNFCAGLEDVTVTLHNYGNNPLTSATINWELNGVPQSPYSWSGLLDTTTNAARETQVTLATMNFQNAVPYTILAWSTMPNGVQDTININDTCTVVTQAAIAGTFTVGGASPDYQTLGDAVKDLNQFGVCGPVILNMRPGNYPEQVAFSDIAGTSATNTITIQSESGKRSDVTITHSASGSADNYVVFMDGGSFIALRDLTMRANASGYAQVVQIGNTSADLTFENLELIGTTTTSTSTNLAVVYSPSGSLNHRVTFRDCGIRDGSYGIYLYGSSTSAFEEDVVVHGNEFTGQYYRPFHAYYLSRLRFHENSVVFTSPYSGAYFTYINYNDDLSVERNTFMSANGGTRYGAYLGNTQGLNNRFANNFVTILNNGSSTTYGLYLSTAREILVAHNTILINSMSTSGRCIYVTGGGDQTHLNNILYNDGAGYAIYTSSTSAIAQSDFNLFHVSGSNIAYWSGARASLTDWQTASGMDAKTITDAVTFADPSQGDLHLSGPSEDDANLYGTLLSNVVDDIDGDRRVNPYRGADEACYLEPGSLAYDLVDGTGQAIAYANAPGSIGVRYEVNFPDYASSVTFTLRLYTIPQNQLSLETSFSAVKTAGQSLRGVQFVALPASLTQGTYKVEVEFNTKNSCDVYRDYIPYATSILIVGEGQKPCVVWPGDANNDGIVTYADRRALNYYLFNAQARMSWLTGPARYRVDAETNPMTYYSWEAQAAAPWYTVDGCYMDTDGNGVINNMDYIAMKLNWSQTTPYYGGAPKSSAPSAASFTMDQNYPNPFNPSTVIRYAVPEEANVRLVVTDALGRQVAELENGRVSQGMHTATFDGAQLSSGTYIATVTMTGIESGQTFTRTVKMLLDK
jgi:hypothetical protein